MELAVRHELHSLPWTAPSPGAHVARTAMYLTAVQPERGCACPITMTFAAVPALRAQPEIAAEWEPPLTTTPYDPELATAVGKYQVCTRGRGHAFEALECPSDNGYVEESGMPRLYRETPLASIREGSGNVMALDVPRASRRSPAVSDVSHDALGEAAGSSRATSRAAEARPAMRAIRRVGLAAEHESPEDPAGSEVRVALTPAAVKQLSEHGREVAVESGAGARMGFSDDEYRAAGAAIVSREEIYRGRELVIKLKGPTHRELASMGPGSLLCCMAHVRSLPERAAICDERAINLLALELVTERSAAFAEAYARSRLAMKRILDEQPRPAEELAIAFAGFSADVFGALQHAARRHPRSVRMLALRTEQSRTPDELLVELRALEEVAASIPEPEVRRDAQRVAARRKIECLHMTGRAGARFGIDLALQVNERLLTAADARVTVLGYGNVSFGALDECVRQGVARTHVRTERTTERALLRRGLQSSDLIINGIDGREDPASYVVTDDDLGSVIRPGTVIVDLVGGSASNRGAVEPIVECTSPSDPCVIVDGVYLASVWGWPLVGFAKPSMERYSEQIMRLLLFEERVLDGFQYPPEGIRQALVAGPLARALAQEQV